MIIHEQLPRFILASGSPRRKELLEAAGLTFDIISVDIDEDVNPELKPQEVVDDLALKKLRACNKETTGKLVITADTLVFKGHNILGKPTDEDDAIRMLKLLSGTNHTVSTAVCLGYYDNIYQFNVSTIVHFELLTEETIDYYIKTYQPFDKAGSYGIQEWIGQVGIDRIEGSYTNVVGLPVAETYKAIVEVSEKWKIS